MKRYAREFVLDGITAADFQQWKHHPVSKLVRRYFQDLERQWGEHQIAFLRNCEGSPDPHKLGEFKGTINATQAAAEIEYQTIFEFYPPDNENEEEPT
jgi:hypothetical protein